MTLKALRVTLLASALGLFCGGVQLRAASADSVAPRGTEFQENTNSSAVLPGKIVKRVQPKYPKEAKKAGLQGEVTVKIVVDEKGRVVKADAVGGDASLQEAAVKAARRWRFEPTLLYGIPVRVTGTISFNFSLQE